MNEYWEQHLHFEIERMNVCRLFYKSLYYKLQSVICCKKNNTYHLFVSIESNQFIDQLVLSFEDELLDFS